MLSVKIVVQLSHDWNKENYLRNSIVKIIFLNALLCCFFLREINLFFYLCLWSIKGTEGQRPESNGYSWLKYNAIWKKNCLIRAVCENGCSILTWLKQRNLFEKSFRLNYYSSCTSLLLFYAIEWIRGPGAKGPSRMVISGNSLT